MTLSLAEIEQAVRAEGLAPRGAFHPLPEDGVPGLEDGRPAATVVLAGNAGPGMWAAFSRAERAADHALDSWSRAVLGRLAGRFGGRALLPAGGPPYWPFQRWAIRAEPLHRSPIGILIHPDYGLWHGYRGALVLAERLDLPPEDQRPSPCESCADKPCLATCPVGAFSAEGYDTDACVAHIEGAAGADCMGEGCRARRACPIGRDYVYAPEQAEFHMAAFVRAHKAGRVG